jgi:CRAL/TRIO domain
MKLIIFLASQCCPLPSYTQGNHRVTVFRLIDSDPGAYDPVENFKMFFMMSDVSFVRPGDIPEGEIGIMDFKGFTFRHFFKFASNLWILRLYLKYIQEAVPFRIHQNHFVNCSSTLTKVMTLIRPFVKKELYDVMHFHTEGFDSLYEHVPRDILPLEYGGDAGKISDFYEEWLQIVESHREYLRNDGNWKLSE